MRRRLRSIKSRILAVAFLFTLASAVIAVSVSLAQFRRATRHSLLQSAEFNLNLVSRVIDQDLDALVPLRDWCAADDNICAYISGAAPLPSDATHAFDHMTDQVRQNRAYNYLLRVIAVSSDRQRILQTGSGTTAGVPLSPYTIQLLAQLDRPEQAGLGWSGLLVDPFTDGKGLSTLYTRAPIYRGDGASRQAEGTVVLLVNTAVVTDPMAGYQTPVECDLFITVGEDSFSPDGASAPIPPFSQWTPTQDEPLSASTRIAQFSDSRGTGLLAVSCPVGATGIWLTQSISPRALNANLWSIYGTQLLILCLGSLLVGAAVAVVLHYAVSRPILQLRQRMAAISEGDFSADPSIEWDNELGDVGRGVNHLSQSVHALMERRLADEKARQDLEYQVLQSQINPHFLYNSLNSIKWMATIQNAPGIAEMTTSLAHLLKSAAKGREILIPLGEELNLLRDYFVIQKYRYGGSITMTEDLQPGLEGALLPRFTLQPLLENAIFHGIEPKGGAGAIRLTARRSGEGLTLTVEDNGVGMEPAQAQALLSGETEDSGGLFRKIGLTNVHRRIQYEFGPEYGLRIESRPGTFTRITVALPFVTEALKKEAAT